VLRSGCAIIGCLVLAAITSPKGAGASLAAAPTSPPAKEARRAVADSASWVYSAPSVRVRDIARLQSVRSNQLVGYGLVVGLDGSGDGSQSPFTFQSIVAMLQRFGVSVDPKKLKTKNVAAVMVTAEIAAFAKSGSKLDVTVSSLGDASSLQGGILLQTPLLGANEEVYAVAQGSVSIGGFSAGGGSVTKNHPTAGRVPEGALVEREIMTGLSEADGSLLINLSSPDFDNASRVAAAVNADLGPDAAVAVDAATIRVRPSTRSADNPVALIAELGELRVQPVTPSKVVLNERTGTVIIGGMVRIAPVAIAHGSLTVEIQTDVQVSQPAPLSNGQTVTLPKTGVNVNEAHAAVMEFHPGTTLAELVRALNALQVTPRDIVAIIQAIKDAGALYAELELQ
jgi:flagellar P-ring protein precursor FlgI